MALLAAAALVAPLVALPTSAGAQPTSCPTTIEEARFASAEELRALNAKIASFGLRNPGSAEHDRMLEWLVRELRAIPGMKVRSDFYTLTRWQPLPRAVGRTRLATSDATGDAGDDGQRALPRASALRRDLAEAGALSVEGVGEIPVSGAIPFTLPTSGQGTRAPLVYIPSDEPITAENARGKIIVRDVEPSFIPYNLFHAISHYATPDFPQTGNYDRGFLRSFEPSLLDASRAGAVGLVFVWDVPGDQVRGYWGPHTGTRYRVSGVFVGNEQRERLRQLAAEGRAARIVVRAKWDLARTRNVIATLPGQTRERIVVNTNTDGNTWVQENGAVGILALARYLATLPIECRKRDVEFALTSAHMGFTNDGLFAYSKQLDEDYEKGTVAFAIVMEHLGTLEQVPSGGPDNRIEITGLTEPIAWSAPEESPALVEASVAAVQRRQLARTMVLQGVGVPDPTQVPRICSQGGLGTILHTDLIPTTSAITGPWSMFDPVYGGEDGIDFEHMRREILALGDVVRSLDGVPREEIAGAYLEEREQRARGAKACAHVRPPLVAPGPGDPVAGDG
ncbi:MAG TPA: hypothetical protein VIS07_18045 [Candidatus Binatia bacterium]